MCFIDPSIHPSLLLTQTLSLCYNYCGLWLLNVPKLKTVSMAHYNLFPNNL